MLPVLGSRLVVQDIECFMIPPVSAFAFRGDVPTYSVGLRLHAGERMSRDNHGHAPAERVANIRP